MISCEEVARVMQESQSGKRFPRIKIPPVKPVTPRELGCRRKVVVGILEHRRKIGPIGIRAEQLVRAVREEAEGGFGA